MPAGARLTLRAAGARRGPAVTADVRTEGGSSRGTPALRGRAATVVTTVDVSGTWSAAIRSKDGTTSGEYTASAKWAARKRFGPTPATLAGAAEATFSFAADAGARVRLVVGAPRGSGALPRIVRVTGPGGEVAGVADATGGRTDRAGPFVAPQTGDYTFAVADTGAAGGAVTATVTVTPPRASKRRIDVRSAALGAGGDQGAFARVVGPDGGTVTVPDTVAGLASIAGSSIDVPPGVLPIGVALVIGTASALDIPSVPDTGLGPTVLFGPEGTRFGTNAAPQNVTISIPVDLAGNGGSRDGVEIWVRDARGRVSLVPPPYDFDTRPGYVSFQTSHFSAYRALVKDGGAPVNPFTMADLPDAADVCHAASLASTPGARFLVATGATGTVELIADGGAGSAPAVTRFAGGGTMTTDGSPRLQFNFQGDVTAVATGATDVVYVGTPTRIFRIAPNGTVTRIAGTGVSGDSGDNGPAVSAQFAACRDLMADLAGTVFLVDDASARVRMIQSPSGTMMPVAGTGTSAFGADDAPIASTSFLTPAGIAFRPTGGFFVCDSGRLRAINPANATNTTVLGDPGGSLGSSGHMVGPTAARFRELDSVSVTPSGDIWVADRGGHTIRRYSPATGLVTLEVGVDDFEDVTGDGAQFPFGISQPRGLLALVPDTVVWAEPDGRVRGFDTAP